MKLSSESKDRLISEIWYCRKKMSEENDPLRKTFFYSGVPVRIYSIYNLEFDPELYFINYVLSTSYNTIANYFAEDRVFKLPAMFFDSLCRYLEQLEEKIRNEEDVYSVLVKIANLSMTADGTGNYLYEKGVLKIED